MLDLRRRQFLTLLGGAAVVWPFAASAQQAMPVIGILAVAAPEANAIRLRAFREGLRTAGYIEGQNVKIEYRWAEAHTGRLPELATFEYIQAPSIEGYELTYRELAARNVDIPVVGRPFFFRRLMRAAVS
jgi:hypothetical protein